MINYDEEFIKTLPSIDEIDQMNDEQLWNIVLKIIHDKLWKKNKLPQTRFIDLISSIIDVNKLLTSFHIIPSKEEEKLIIKQLERENSLKLGEEWYIISSEWWESWCEYVDYHSKQLQLKELNEKQLSNIDSSSNLITNKKYRPRKIDNNKLLDESNHFVVLKENLIEHNDYEIIHKHIWEQLYEWYGGGPNIMRSVISIDSKIRNQLLLFKIKKNII